jgi:molybdate transport system permease protein
MSSLPAPAARPREPSARSDAPFYLGLAILGGLYAVLIVALLLADVHYLLGKVQVDPSASFGGRAQQFLQSLWWNFAGRALASPEIRYAIKLSLVSTTITMILSVWFAVPAGYVLSRFRFPGKGLLDAIVDIPIVLPPLVIGLSLLILFQTWPGRALEQLTSRHMGSLVGYGLLPLAACVLVVAVLRLSDVLSREPRQRALSWLLGAGAGGIVLLVVALTPSGGALREWAQRRLATEITYAIPSVILAQFAVACAFAVRTMRVTFDQISPRPEQVALTLGCSRAQAFWMVVLPDARRGIIAAATVAWARALGEFGPILVFSGATRMRTEVLPTTIFLELSVGSLDAAVAVSLMMVAAAVAVLIIVRANRVLGSA